MNIKLSNKLIYYFPKYPSTIQLTFEMRFYWDFEYIYLFQTFQQTLGVQMSKGLIWATADDLARNRGKVLSLYRQILRSLNSPDLPLNLAARLHRKAQARAIFMLAAEERSIHNIKDLFDIADYSLSLLRKGEIPKYIQ